MRVSRAPTSGTNQGEAKAKQRRASITVSATFGHQKTRSASSNAIYLWYLRVLSSKKIAWGARCDDQGRCFHHLRPIGPLREDVSNLWICYPLGVRKNHQGE